MEHCAGFVLSVTRFSETSLIASVLTREHGRLSALAKGALRKGSPFAATLEPFALCEFTLSLRKNRDVQTLCGASLLDYFKRVRDDMHLSTAAQIALELVRRTVHEGEPLPALYRLLSAYLVRLDTGGPFSTRAVEKLMTSFQMHFLKVMGFGPVFDSCVGCGSSPLTARAAVSARAGGALCASCAGGVPDAHRAPGRLLMEMGALFKARDGAAAGMPLSDPGLAADIVTGLLSACFEKDMRLKCLDYFHTL